MTSIVLIKDVKRDDVNLDARAMVIRDHFASIDVKDDVIRYLERDGDKIKVETNNYLGQPFANKVLLDHGGMMMASWKPFYFSIDDLEFGVWAHHIDHMYRMVHHALDNQGKLGFCRIPTWRWHFCTTERRVRRFLEALRRNEDEIRARERTECEEYEKTIEDLNRDGVRVLPPPTPKAQA